MDDDILFFVNENSLSKELCSEIIQLFENNTDKYPGITGGGLNKSVKNTTDLVIPMYDVKWKRIYKFILSELQTNIKKYFSKMSEFNYNDNLTLNTIQVQKYNKGEGKYIYHDDARIYNGKCRKITFIWYLNNITDGGETEFTNFKVKPEAGKLVLFPSSWVYPHRANVPISDDKYIMTGWLLEKTIIYDNL